MKNLSFDDGRQSFMVNNDPNRVIRFNPADPEIINRVLNLQEEFEGYQLPEGIELNPDGTPKNDMEKEGAYIAEFTSTMRKAFNNMFNADVYDKIFDGQSPLCIVNQHYLYEGVLESLKELMDPAMEAYREQKQKLTERMNKYLGDV